MADKKILFVEGEPNSSNGNLRQGFEKLLQKKLQGKLPRIILGGGKPAVVDKFLNNQLEGNPFILIDLDSAEEDRDIDIKKYKLDKNSDKVFYMIQEMESWFLSQPDVLDKFYGVKSTGKKISEIIVNRKASDISSPKEVLKGLTKDLNKKEEYREIKHAVELLKLLDVTKLENEFPDFKQLIKKLNA